MPSHLEGPVGLRGAKGDKGDKGAPGSPKRVISWAVYNPSTNLSTHHLIRLIENVKPNKLSAKVEGASTPTVTFNIEERTHPPSSTGTNLFSSNQTATLAGNEWTSFTNTQLDAGNWLSLIIKSTAGTPYVVYFSLEVELL